MVIIKTKDEIVRLKEGGPLLARILATVAAAAKPGVTTASLDALAATLIQEAGGKAAFLNYQPEGADYPYPASLCVSINSEVVHGIPGTRILKEGDIVSLDLGLNHKGVFLDHAVTVAVGAAHPKDKTLLAVCHEALMAGIAAARGGNTVGDIGYAIQSVIKPYKFGIVRTLSGHGVGRAIHEDPYVPNYGKPGKGEKLKPGMVIAIEPMITRGSEEVYTAADGYTIKTADNSRAAHFEHTILITEGEPEILTIEK
ncbi:MAG TPA: type I methionyl aminopeptidase [Candidatus Paceibacterota bacterium]|nr:type I methionyl aminopeptidase [Candidatus Paceibacterota bacterium]